MLEQLTEFNVTMNKLNDARRAAILRALCEGNSVRATARLQPGDQDDARNVRWPDDLCVDRRGDSGQDEPRDAVTLKPTHYRHRVALAWGREMARRCCKRLHNCAAFHVEHCRDTSTPPAVAIAAERSER